MKKHKYTYAEAIKNALNKIDDDSYPVCFQYLCHGLSTLQIWLARTILLQDMPDVSITSGKNTIKYSGAADFSENGILRLISGADILSPKSLSFDLEWGKFIDWLLDEEIFEFDENTGNFWYDVNTLIGKWNEFITKEQNDDNFQS